MEYLLEREDETYGLIQSTERKMLIADILAMLLGLTGTGLALYEYELFFDFASNYITDGILVSNGNSYLKTEPDKNFYLRIMISLLTALLCMTIYYRYHFHLKIQKYRGNFDSFDTLKTSGLHVPLLLEVLVCVIHIPPRVNYAFQLSQYEGKYVYTINMFVALFMFVRVYLLWRFFIQYSEWNSGRSNAICRSCNCKGGANFAIKAELKDRPYYIVITMICLSIIIFGVSLRNAERPFNYVQSHDWSYVWNGMWCIIITMTTVGYGDYFASTHFGRIISVFACFWGTFLISLMVLSLTISTEFSPQESKSFNKIKKDEAEEEVRIKAANAIKFGIKLKIFLRKHPNASEKSKSKVINKFKGALIEFRTFSMKLKASEQDAPIELILSRLNDKVTYLLDKIKNDCYVYKSINSKLDASENNQKIIFNAIEELYKLNEVAISRLKSN